MTRSWRQQLPTLLLVLTAILVSCADPTCNRCSAKLNHFMEIMLVVAWVCGGLFMLLFVGGAVASAVKNRRGPTAMSVAVGKLLGGSNMLIGGMILFSAFSDPPTSAPPSGERDVDEMLLFTFFALVWFALGLKVFAVAMKPGR